MIEDPKIGDIVTLDPKNPAGWECYLHNDQFIVTKVFSPRTSFDGYPTAPVRLRKLRGRQVFGEYNGVWSCYLNRNEFLTAARQAIKKERKHASRAKTAQKAT